MATEDDIHSVLLEILDERRKWGRPTSQPAQSPDQITGGGTQYPAGPGFAAASALGGGPAPSIVTDPLMAQREAVHQQQAFQVQQYLQN